jgi:cell division protein FtsW
MWLGNVRLRHLIGIGLVLGIIIRIGALVANTTVEHNTKMRRHKEPISSFWLNTEKFVRRTRLATINTRANEYAEKWFGSKTSKNADKLASKDFTQVDYAHLAIASASILPSTGPGNSEVKYMLPESFSDFIFAIIVEEYGVLLSTLFILLIFFIVLPWQIGLWSKKSQNLYATYLLFGIGILLSLQAVAHVWVCVGLLPVTGQNLPLVSHGGSSIICSCILFGLLLNVINFISKMEQKEKEAILKAVPAEQNMME